MKNTKEKIAETAKDLFNEHGYSQVTVRMIAQAVNMSSGNLNYHFRKREDILEYLYFEMVAPFDQRVQKLEGEKLTLKKMHEDVLASMKIMVEFQFFWVDLHLLLTLSEKIQEHFNKAFAKRKGGYLYLIEYFQQEKIIKEAAFSTQYEWLIERLISYSNTWLYASVLYEKNKIDEEYIENCSVNLVAMLYPYLTDLGKSEFQALFPDYFK